jgi:uncharacterized protein YjbI with pentapeptide repeats
MANSDHISIIRDGVEFWNRWRAGHTSVVPDLSGAELRGMNLEGANFCAANLNGVDLTGANLLGGNLERAQMVHALMLEANLNNATLQGADMTSAAFANGRIVGGDLRNATLAEATFNGTDVAGADLSRANLQRTSFYGGSLRWARLESVDLRDSDLRRANCTGAVFADADLRGANLENADLQCANFTRANLRGCRVYGISAWNLNLEGANQADIIITSSEESQITVDNIEVAQFIHLLLRSQKIRHLIDTLTSKVVLILGRFTAERKLVLDALSEQLRRRDYLPVLFDFDKPVSRNLTETVSTLAHLARFVVADITDARSIPQELLAIVPNLPSVPIQPLLLASQQEYGMFEHFRHFPWVLQPYMYEDLGSLISSLEDKVIRPAESMVRTRK